MEVGRIHSMPICLGLHQMFLRLYCMLKPSSFLRWNPQQTPLGQTSSAD